MKKHLKIRALGIAALAVGAAGLLTLSGCGPAVPVRACELIDVAAQEGCLSEEWHLTAGKVLKACGAPNAEAHAARRARRAFHARYPRLFNDNKINCEAKP